MHLTLTSPPAGHSAETLGVLPDPAHLPPVPSFTPSGGPAESSLDILADAALGASAHDATIKPSSSAGRSLHTTGPYNPAATLPPRVVKKILQLEFVEMSELRADIWPDEAATPETTQLGRRPGKPPVTSIRSWLECYGRMAAVLSMRFPEKAAELWAYQTSILHAAHAYEGANWVAYDRLYRREMLAKKDLDWSVPNPRLYSEAFTGRAKRHPQCPHCLSEDHMGAGCPHNPNPPVMGWLQTPAPLQGPLPSPGQTPGLPQAKTREICRNFNANRCRFARCRFLHICSECLGQHAAAQCPQSQTAPAYRATAPRGRSQTPARGGRLHPYFPGHAPTPDQQ